MRRRSRPGLDESRQADLFLADLFGHRPPRLIHPTESDAEGFFDSFAAMPSGGATTAAPQRSATMSFAEDTAEDVALAAPFTPPFDAAVVWPNRSAYFFKGDKYVRYQMNPEGIASGYPRKIKGNWPGLWECDIDAAVVWNDNTAYFFKGDEFVKYRIKSPEGAESGYPMKIAKHWPGLWARDIDAVVVLNDGMACFFKGDEYIRYPLAEPIEKQRGEAPRKIQSKWPQLWSRDLDAALTWDNGMAYFFKCSRYIGYAVDGSKANASRGISDNWKGLVGMPSGWRLDRFPQRPASAKGGKAFFNDLERAPARNQQPSVEGWLKRERAMADELIAGNMPSALLRWVKIEMSHEFKSGPNKGLKIRGWVRVLPDYLAIGDDGDYVHVPLDPWSAQRVASAFGALLPTACICHAVYLAAAKIPAITRSYAVADSERPASQRGIAQASTAAYLEHSIAIQNEMKKAPSPITPGTLVAGHKKDVVLAAAIIPQAGRPDKSAYVAYHGFYDPKGWPFEPCYHTADKKLNKSIPKDIPTPAHQAAAKTHLYADYSHAVRLVHPMMELDGNVRCVTQVLAHPVWSYLISTEGSINPARIPKPTREMARGFDL